MPAGIVGSDAPVSYGLTLQEGLTMKRLLLMMTVAGVVVTASWFACAERISADEGKKELDINELFDEAAEILDEYGMPGYWRGAYFLGKVGKEGTEDLREGLEEEEILLRIASAQRLLQLYVNDEGKTAESMMEQGEKALLKIATDKEEEPELRALTMDVLGAWGRLKNGKALLAIAKDREVDDLVRYAAAVNATRLNEDFEQKKFVEGLLKSDNPRLRHAAATTLYTIARSKKAAGVLQEYRDDASIQGLLADRLLKNADMSVALKSMKALNPEEVDKKMVAELEEEYEKLFARAEEITAKVKGVRDFGRQLAKTVKHQDGEPVEEDDDEVHMLSLSLVNDEAGEREPEHKGGGEDVEKRFEAALEPLRGGDVDAFWASLRILTVLDRDAAELLESGMEEVGLLERIACAGAVLRIFEKPADDKEKKLRADAQELLWKAIKGEREDPEIRHLATNVLGKYGGEENSKQLLEYAKVAFDPFVRLSAIRGAYYITGRILGKDFLKEKLESDDLDMKAWAIITLCEMGDFAGARNYFDHVKDEPTLRGRLIQEYIQTDKMMRRLEVLYLGGPQLEHAAHLRIEIEHIKGQIETRTGQLKEAAEAAREVARQFVKEDLRKAALADIDRMTKPSWETEERPEGEGGEGQDDGNGTEMSLP